MFFVYLFFADSECYILGDLQLFGGIHLDYGDKGLDLSTVQDGVTRAIVIVDLLRSLAQLKFTECSYEGLDEANPIFFSLEDLPQYRKAWREYGRERLAVQVEVL